jgi:hypothetical protein
MKTAKACATFVRRKGDFSKFSQLLLTAFLTLAPLGAPAAVTAKDVQVAARVLGFTTTPFTGPVKFGIVYNPANPSSAADERALLGILGRGLTVGNVTLIPELVPIGQVRSRAVDVLFLTSGLTAQAEPVAAAAAAHKVMCITTDPAATAAGDCAVSVQSDPAVEITVNMAAAAASNLSFGTAFMLMVNQI